jgi:membrane-associated HD superfamily phosphohydrolase
MKIDKTVVRDKIAADRRLGDIEKELERVYKKKAEAENNISELQTLIEEAVSLKNTALADLACGIIDQSTMNAAASKLADLQQKLSMQKEILNALQIREKEIGRELPGVESLKRRYDSEVWAQITNNIISGIPEEIRSTIATAFVANLRSAHPFSRDIFLQEIFPPLKEDDIQAIRIYLDKIFHEAIK